MVDSVQLKRENAEEEKMLNFDSNLIALLFIVFGNAMLMYRFYLDDREYEIKLNNQTPR